MTVDGANRIARDWDSPKKTQAASVGYFVIRRSGQTTGEFHDVSVELLVWPGWVRLRRLDGEQTLLQIQADQGEYASFVPNEDDEG